MIKEVFGVGATVEDATQNAFKHIGIDPDQTEFEVITEIIEMPEKKVLGLFGGKEAKVKITIKQDQVQVAVNFITKVIRHMGVGDAKLEVVRNEDSKSVIVNLDSTEIVSVIGKKGETLEALQYLTGLIANRGGSDYCRVSINAGNYRERRSASLEALARRTAITAVRTGRNISLEPMNPYERRIIHTAVQKIANASSWSKGENDGRYVVIGKKGVAEGKDGEPLSKFNNHNKRGFQKRDSDFRGGDRRPSAGSRSNNSKPFHRNKASVSSYTPTDVKREPKNEVISAPLYGKIDIN